MRARHILLGAFVLLALAHDASGEPAPSPTATPPVGTETKVKTTEPRLLCIPATPVERCLKLPPGRFVDEDTWQRIDRETRERQERITRLDAENKSFRETAASWQPGWKTLLSATVVGMIGGAALYRRLE